ncbi:uncharacterized protein LOC125778079 [Bactrocera dorsalis]|uniref:Uncharacterized protein LOC125778079 n=1 Tax=Bactrocera dorsalis TaxID=27457 RepID=A0ABM3JM65_BACDO|nr:uncharacterized protein LOC125778079 [Bactrocera dorsalis]
MDDEKLISLVESRSELYDKSNKFYKLQSRKDGVWNEIGRELNASGEMCRRRWLTLRDRYGREARKVNAPSGSGTEFQRQWHLLDSMKFLKPHILPRPIRFSHNICVNNIATATGQSTDETVVQGDAQEESPPLWPLSPIGISPPSPSPPFPVAQSIPSPSPSASTSVPSPSCYTQVANNRGRKRGSSGPTSSEIDQKMIEAIEVFKHKIESIQPTQQTQQQQSTNPAVKSFTSLMASILNKMDEAKQTRAMEKALQAVFDVQNE